MRTLAAAAMLMLALPALSAELVDITRTTPFDFQTQYDDGSASNHQSRDAAGFACANFKAANPGRQCFVQGGRWRITVNLPAAPPPVVEPPVVDPPPPTPIGEALLGWAHPTRNTDGSRVTVPVTCRLEYGRGDWSLQVMGLRGTTYNVTGLAPGVWQFRLYCIADGAESQASNAVTKEIL